MNKRKHFHTFDALRFFAVFLVFLTHVPLPIPGMNLFNKSGGIGVQFFFVLSGFLISYIILFEKKANGKLNLKKFFIRRILRIWPLFYAMIAFAFLTPYIIIFLGLNTSSEGYDPNWLVSCLFLENYKMMFSDSFPNVSPLTVMWSLCIEEHFYILWGILFYCLPIRRIPFLIFLSIIIANLTRIYYFKIGLDTADLFSNLDFFAFGAIPAYCVITKNRFIDKLSRLSGFIKYMLAFVTCAYIFLSPNVDYIYQEYMEPSIFCILFSLLIFFTLLEKNNLHISSSNLLSKAGIYTYGIYLFHTIVINLLLQLAKRFQIDLNISMNGVLFFIIALGLSILISIASYHWFEKRFLNLKSYFY